MSKKPKISVLMSVYNNEKTLNESIESILNQSYENFEFLIIDDYSTDKSIEIIKKFSNFDKRVKYYKNSTNIGLTKSLNKLIEKSSGEYIARQDSDDTSDLQRLDVQLNFVESTDYEVVTTRANIIGKKRVIPNLSFYFPNKYVIRYKNPFIHGSLFINSKILNKLGNYDERFYYSQDYKLMFDLIKQKNKIKIIKQPLYNLNMNNNISSQFREEQKYFADCVRLNKAP